MNKFKDYDETIEDLIASVKGVETLVENVFLADTLERVLAEDIVAKESSPLHVTSSMDGYAIRFEDQEKGVLKLEDRVPAGTDISTVVRKGTCVKTFTGSLMSEGSDTLIPIENVEVNGDEVKIITPVAFGSFIRPIGESYKEGEVLIKKGSKIGFAEIGVMGELSFVQVPVYCAPKVAVIATGSEILDLGEPKTSPAQIRSSNHVTLEAIAKSYGAKVNRIGVVHDDKELIKTKIVESLKHNDIVVTTGGVSVGDYDFVKDIIQGMDPEYVVNRAYVKPGRHIRVVKIDSKYIVALPGFPYSAAVMCFVYILPLIKAMQGQNPEARYIDAIIEEEYKKRSPYTEFTACNLLIKDGKFYVNLEGKKRGSSAILNNMLDGSALLRVERDTKVIKKGEKVRVLPMGRLL
ncbi:molybdopterin molybdotransferase MoeA [Sulfurospirillum arcachonense]|uniref:molybdopterin molybdotransferase MoeA n=1 Tax=Sulfurospirillum arcachonense TaxID=57666 RepID=UPI0004688C38|nr:molybdopterin molybdotransferase MoeA [Sulfurospirillum arcachonense]